MQEADGTDATSEFWRRLLHRWFVQYNPIYLVSALLVLGGTIATSRGLARDGSLYGPLGVAIIAEIYAGALIGGAALLIRIGQRRPAVMLAMITVLYQADPTLHTETCALLGTAGALASALWLALFVLKLYALAWAVRIRLSPRAVVTAVVGAAGVTLAPYVLPRLDPSGRGAAVAVLVVVLGLLLPSAERGDDAAAVASVPEGLTPAAEAWHHTVLRRSLRVAWTTWGLLLGLHVLFWSMQQSIALVAVVPAFALLALRRIRTESRLWAAVTAMLGGALLLAPASLSTCAILVSLVLVHRAVSRVRSQAKQDGAPAAADRSPYRVRRAADEDEHEPPHVAARRAVVTFDDVPLAERVRLFSGALFAVHLALWTAGWTGGALPAHSLALDAPLVIAVALVVWRLRARLVLLPLAATGAHALAVAGLVPLPRTLLEWGGAAMTLGFMLLVASLVTSYRLRHVSADVAAQGAQGAPASRQSR